MAVNQLDLIMSQVQQLSLNEQIRLLERIASLLNRNGQAQAAGSQTSGFVYGKYRDAPGPMSTEADFRLAEWHPTEADLNGP